MELSSQGGCSPSAPALSLELCVIAYERLLLMLLGDQRVFPWPAGLFSARRVLTVVPLYLGLPTHSLLGPACIAVWFSSIPVPNRAADIPRGRLQAKITRYLKSTTISKKDNMISNKILSAVEILGLTNQDV